MSPVEKEVSLIGPYRLLATIQVPEDSGWFQGHFDSQPILPGVAQLEWVILYARKHFGADINLAAIEQIKFLAPVMPGDLIFLDLNLDVEKNKLLFKYQIVAEGVEKVLSSGKMSLCRQNG